MQTKTSAPTSPSRDRGGGRDRDPVADAADLDEHLAGARSGRAACPAASRSPIAAPRRRRRPRRRIGAWARWQRARAAASAASAGVGRRGQAEQRLHHASAPAPCRRRRRRRRPASPRSGEYWATSRAGGDRLGHGEAAGLADRHRGAHVDLEEHPLDGDDRRAGARRAAPAARRCSSASRCGSGVGRRGAAARRWRRRVAGPARCSSTP